MVSADRLALLLIGVGIVLTASPVAVVSADIGAPTYEYRASELSYEDGTLQYSDQIPFSTFSIDAIACVGESRACKLERHVHENGRVAVEDADAVRGYYEFVFLDGSFYRPVTTRENGTVYLTHEPVRADFALRAASVSYDSAESAYRRAVDEGHVTVTSTERLEMRKVVSKESERGDRTVYYVYATKMPPAGGHTASVGEKLTTYGLSIAGFLVGLALIGYGQRMRVRARLR